MNGLSVLELVQLSNGDLLIFVDCRRHEHLQSAQTLNEDLGQGVKVWAHYSIV